MALSFRINKAIRGEQEPHDALLRAERGKLAQKAQMVPDDGPSTRTAITEIAACTFAFYPKTEVKRKNTQSVMRMTKSERRVSFQVVKALNVLDLNHPSCFLFIDTDII